MKLSTFILGSTLALVNARTINVKEGDSIQKALEQVKPGDTIKISDGTYFEDLETVVDGEPDKRITIKGSRKAVLKGTNKKARLFEIHHDYYTIDGFTIDGKHNDGKKESDYVDKLLYVHGNRKTRTIKQYGKEFRSSIDGLIVSNMKLINAAGECARFRYFVTNLEVAGCHIENCGVVDFEFNDMKSGVNGESLYFGTSSNQWSDGKNPTSEADGSRYAHIHHNVFKSKANELDIKEGSEYVLVEHNECSTQLDPNSGCFDSRSDNNIFRFNEIFSNANGVRIGGHKIKDKQYGKGNEVYGNKFSDNSKAELIVQTGLNKVCGNECEGDCKITGSTRDDHSDMKGSCSGLMDIYWVSGDKSEKPKDSSSDENSKDSSDDEPKVSGTVKSNSDDSSNDSRDLKEDSESGSSDSDSDSGSDSSSDSDSESSDSNDRRRLGDEEYGSVYIYDFEVSMGENTASMELDHMAINGWSSMGLGESIDIILAGETEINALDISFHEGDEKIYEFDLYIDGKLVLESQKSEKTLILQTFEFEKTIGKVVSIMTNGNDVNDWFSTLEIVVIGKKQDLYFNVEETKSVCDEVKKIDVEIVQGSSGEAGNIMDGDLSSAWKTKGEQDLTFKFNGTQTITEIGMAGDPKNVQTFDVTTMNKNGDWKDYAIDMKTKPSNGIQSYEVEIKDIKMLKLTFYDESNFVSEVELWGC